VRARQAADYDASIAGWDFWSCSESYGPTDELRNEGWVGSFLLDKEWFDSSDRSLASERCSSVLDGFGVDGVRAAASTDWCEWRWDVMGGG